MEPVEEHTVVPPAPSLASWVMGAAGVMCGLLLGGLFFLLSSPHPGQPILLKAPPSPAPIQVHVAGAVSVPGVYLLPAGSRVQDAVQAAGGFTDQADARALNLAAFVQDGGRVDVPDSLPVVTGGDTTPSTSSRQSSILPLATTALFININTASQAELESLPGIGPVIAQEIITYRQQHGLFQTIEQIMDVPGIGPGTFQEIKDQITVDAGD